MAMTKIQAIHLNERLNQVVADAKEAIRLKHTKAERAISDKDRYRLIHRGLVSIKKGVTEIGTHDDVVDIFDFSEHEWDERTDQAAFQKEFTEFRAKTQPIRDQIILGDAPSALKAIHALEEKGV